MSKSYNVRGKRFQRLYKAPALTASASAEADSATIAAVLCEVPWTETEQRSAVFPLHSGAQANDEANVNNRELFDAAKFCAEHDTKSGRHRAYAQAACYRFAIPDESVVLQSVNAYVNCDPYTPNGARIAIYTSDSGSIPTKCSICRTGSDNGESSVTVASDTDGDGVNDTWSSTGKYVSGVAPRTYVALTDRWFAGAGHAVISPTGGLALKKYLFVFVLLEDYSYTARNGYLEGSSYILPNVTIVTSGSVAKWDEKIAAGATVVDASGAEHGVTYPVCRGGSLPAVDPSLCGNVAGKTGHAETPLTDTCFPPPERVSQYREGTVSRLVISASPIVDLSSESVWNTHVAFGQSMSGLSVNTGSKVVRGAAQLIYPIAVDSAFWYHLYPFPMFNCHVRNHGHADTTPYSMIAAYPDAAIGTTDPEDYFPQDYNVPPPLVDSGHLDNTLADNQTRVYGTDGSVRLRTIRGTFTVADDGGTMGNIYGGLTLSENGGFEKTPVELYSPFSQYTHRGMVSVGANISSISCLLNVNDGGSPLNSFAPGVRILVSSYSPSIDSKQMSSFFEFVEYPKVFGLSDIRETSAYSLLSNKTATSVFIGDAFGLDSDLSGMPTLDDIYELLNDVGNDKAVMLYDAVHNANTVFPVYQTLGGEPVDYTGNEIVIGSTGAITTVGDTSFVKGIAGGDYQLVYVFGNYSAPSVRQAYAQRRALQSTDTASVSYPVYVTDGTHTYILAVMRLVSRRCPDIVAYPITADENRYAPSISTIGLTTSNANPMKVTDKYKLNVKPCFLTDFTGTFVQFWAPPSDLSARDFGACSGVRRTRLQIEKKTGYWFSFDESSSDLEFDSEYTDDLIHPYTYSNNTQAGTCSFTYDGHTLSGVGEIYGVYAPPVRYGTYVYVYGSFTSFGGQPCRSVVKVRFIDNVPIAGLVKIDSVLFPLVGPESSASSGDIRFSLHPARSCSTDATFSEDDVIVVAQDSFSAGSIGDVTSCQVSMFGSSSPVVSALPPSISDQVTVVTKSLLVADADAGIVAKVDGLGSGFVYEVDVYPEDTFLDKSSGDPTIGMRNCMARFYEGSSSMSPSTIRRSVGPTFLVGRAKKSIKVWASTVDGQQIVGKDVPVWRIVFSPICVPFSLPSGTNCTRMTIDWSSIRLSEDTTEPYESSGESVSYESSSVAGVSDRSAFVSRYAKCTKGTKYNVWLNRKERVGAVPESVAVDHAFYDATKSVIGDWELVATIDPYSSTRITEVSIGAFTGDVGTVALTAWYPFDTIDATVGMSGMLGSGEATDFSTGIVTPVKGNGFVPDVIFGR